MKSITKFTTEQLIEEIERRSMQSTWPQTGIISMDVKPGSELTIYIGKKWTGSYYNPKAMYKAFVFMEPLHLVPIYKPKKKNHRNIKDHLDL